MRTIETALTEISQMIKHRFAVHIRSAPSHFSPFQHLMCDAIKIPRFHSGCRQCLPPAGPSKGDGQAIIGYKIRTSKHPFLRPARYRVTQSIPKASKIITARGTLQFNIWKMAHRWFSHWKLHLVRGFLSWPCFMARLNWVASDCL